MNKMMLGPNLASWAGNIVKIQLKLSNQVKEKETKNRVEMPLGIK